MNIEHRARYIHYLVTTTVDGAFARFICLHAVPVHWVTMKIMQTCADYTGRCEIDQRAGICQFTVTKGLSSLQLICPSIPEDDDGSACYQSWATSTTTANPPYRRLEQRSWASSVATKGFTKPLWALRV